MYGRNQLVVSTLERCPFYRGVHIEGVYCIDQKVNYPQSQTARVGEPV